MPFYPVLGEGSPTESDYYRKKGTLILTSPLKDLDLTEFSSMLKRHPTAKTRAKVSQPASLVAANLALRLINPSLFFGGASFHPKEAYDLVYTGLQLEDFSCRIIGFKQHTSCPGCDSYVRTHGATQCSLGSNN